ncbi:MAG: hypothetical protein M3426_11560 [Actinomycetota bacterium]|nr:hypothetical protein [Actinomycetota bacterium]
MSKVEPASLVQLLQRPILRIRTGVVLLPLVMLGRERELAALLAIEAVDWRDWKLTHLSSDSHHLGLSSENVLRDLREIIEDVDIAGNCLWIYNVDLALSALRYDERLRFWAFLYSTFKQRRGLLFSLPAQASNLLPPEELIAWEKDERLARWEGA